MRKIMRIPLHAMGSRADRRRIRRLAEHYGLSHSRTLIMLLRERARKLPPDIPDSDRKHPIYAYGNEEDYQRLEDVARFLGVTASSAMIILLREQYRELFGNAPPPEDEADAESTVQEEPR